MTDFLIQLVYTSVDTDDDATLNALAQAGVTTAQQLDGDLAVLTAGVQASNAVEAARIVMDAVQQSLPAAVPIESHRDLVSITDIGDRVGVTREAVRNWNSGKRGPGGFPVPAGSPSDYKVWEWSAVHAWLRHHMGIWDGLDMPNHVEYGLIDNEANQRSTSHVATVAAPEPVPGWVMVGHEDANVPSYDWFASHGLPDDWTAAQQDDATPREPVAA
ncbi:MAG: hypothetical protein WD942_04625 [Dehalococcoidia bacterium]